MQGQFVPGFGPALLTCSGFALLSMLAAVIIVPQADGARRDLAVKAAPERVEHAGVATRRAG